MNSLNILLIRDKLICNSNLQIPTTTLKPLNAVDFVFIKPNLNRLSNIMIILSSNKAKLIIFDIGDKLQYGERHLLKRIELYKKEKINYGIKEITEQEGGRKEGS